MEVCRECKRPLELRTLCCKEITVRTNVTKEEIAKVVREELAKLGKLGKRAI